MKVDILVPVMGESVLEASVSNLLVSSGSVVSSGKEIMELETDKVNQIVYAPQDGKVTFSVSVGDVVKVGDVIGFIEEAEGVQAPCVVEESKKEMVEPSKAEEDLKPKNVTRKKMTTLRKTIANKLVEVKNTTAMLTTFNEVDLSAVMAIRAEEKEQFEKKYGVKLGFMSFFIKAAVAALKAYPQINARIEEDEIVTFHTYDISVAVSTDKGLFVPVIKGCDTLSFGAIEKRLAELATKAREGTIAIEDLQGGSFTITNGGVFGSLLSTPILNPPQSAILGMHAIVKRPVVIEEAIEIRPMMYLALSYDHRIVDGKDAVLFLIDIKKSLEDPGRLLLDM